MGPRSLYNPSFTIRPRPWHCPLGDAREKTRQAAVALDRVSCKDSCLDKFCSVTAPAASHSAAIHDLLDALRTSPCLRELTLEGLQFAKKPKKSHPRPPSPGDIVPLLQLERLVLKEFERETWSTRHILNRVAVPPILFLSIVSTVFEGALELRPILPGGWKRCCKFGVSES
ncbi:hypothetical protein BOTBODRAFT_402445 [Botryobasidium botryosum FD-172 SS1]|uniref:Uncharacterized protein n=1 Tax=Botryobasidium botryosum (strain FD-172 SS1) TaxID=930990 RepID=A0A067MEE8_BOTB1|nr:hypothetical protein BOTBODRAFT_402445 [Botryobasidium botryosum FD-172 SS1]